MGYFIEVGLRVGGVCRRSGRSVFETRAQQIGIFSRRQRGLVDTQIVISAGILSDSAGALSQAHAGVGVKSVL